MTPDEHHRRIRAAALQPDEETDDQAPTSSPPEPLMTRSFTLFLTRMAFAALGGILMNTTPIPWLAILISELAVWQVFSE